MRFTLCTACVLVGMAALLVGCQSNGPRLGGLNPFFQVERTAFLTPKKRIEAIRAKGDQSNGQDTPEQQAIVQELVATLAAEQDPNIRQASLETLARFNTPLASRALLAGLSDESSHVRLASCQMLSQRAPTGCVEALTARVRDDESFDVRIAAAKALGKVGASERDLLPILEDSDPAMQLVGVEAMRRKTGKDLGGNVAAYVALAKGESLPADESSRVEIANRLPDWVPFF